LLRGINLGGHKRVVMGDLRKVVTSLGHGDVTTYIQSGNVVFTPAAAADVGALAADLERAIAENLGVRSRVVVLSRDELAQIVRDNPYQDETNPKAVHAMFLSELPGPEAAESVAVAQRQVAAKGSRDEARVIGRTLFLHTPDGYGRSELAAQVMRTGVFGKAGTARNWATVLKLLSLCDA
jgi:uncharacterized protein (DUF1697 family)